MGCGERMEIDRAIAEFQYRIDSIGKNYKDDMPDYAEALKIAVSALKKQSPMRVKKMEYKPLIDIGWKYACPECGCAVVENEYDTADITQEDDFCPTCGQKLDWGK